MDTVRDEGSGAPTTRAMRSLLIIGAGAQASLRPRNQPADSRADVIGLIDSFENQDLWASDVGGVRVLGGLAALDGLSRVTSCG